MFADFKGMYNRVLNSDGDRVDGYVVLSDSNNANSFDSGDVVAGHNFLGNNMFSIFSRNDLIVNDSLICMSHVIKYGETQNMNYPYLICLNHDKEFVFEYSHLNRIQEFSSDFFSIEDFSKKNLIGVTTTFKRLLFDYEGNLVEEILWDELFSEGIVNNSPSSYSPIYNGNSDPNRLMLTLWREIYLFH
jgi:hypothetical protein